MGYAIVADVKGGWTKVKRLLKELKRQKIPVLFSDRFRCKYWTFTRECLTCPGDSPHFILKWGKEKSK